ncbi:acyltransferase [Streptomyces griseorubiginosus]|uniref:acyltransferase family protein n=1 Tax=Streptomyces griseorubiginosus TaxID=67304 RepID=UPI0033B41578
MNEPRYEYEYKSPNRAAVVADTLRLRAFPVGAGPVAEPVGAGPVVAREAAGDAVDEVGGRRFSAVDGLRGAAVLAVLLHDTGVGGRWSSGSGTGVDVLLVLAGFLTTLPLIRRATRAGRTGVLGFLTRRTKRLVPALLISLALTLTICRALGPPRTVRDLVRQLPSVLLGYGGWSDWLHGLPLNTTPTTTSPLAPLWLLDLTARSVLAWSVLLACLCLLARRRLTGAALGASLLTAAYVMAAAAADGTRVHGIDLGGVSVGMQTLSLPAGAVAACCVHLAERGTRALSRRTAALLTATGLAAATAVAVSAVLRDAGPHENRYTAVTVASAALLTAALCTGRGPLARLLSTALLSEVGRMSAALFLLHLPVFWLLERARPGLSPLALFLVGGAATWFLSLLTHYLLAERLASRSWRPGSRG